MATLAGQSSWWYNDGIGTQAAFNSPKGITTDGTNLYVADYNNHTIRKIVIATSEVTTLAGLAMVSGSSDGIGTEARFTNPWGIITDGTNLYVTDNTRLIRKIVIATGAVSTLAVSDSLDGITGITTDGTSLYLANGWNTIQKVDIATGTVTTIAGVTRAEGLVDGTGAEARFRGPLDVTTDGTNLFVLDTRNHMVRRIQ